MSPLLSGNPTITVILDEAFLTFSTADMLSLMKLGFKRRSSGG